MKFTNNYTEKEMNKILTIQKLIDKTITMDEAIGILQLSERQIYRYISTYKFEGPPGFIHGLKSRPSNNKGERRKLEGLRNKIFLQKYHDFGPTLLAEELSKEMGYDINKETLRLAMIRWGKRNPKIKKIKIKRQNRERKSNYGILIQFDGSYHDWLENGSKGCLLCSIDDATGKIIYMKFGKSENLEDVISFWKEYIIKNGKPQYIYVDKHSSYKVNYPKDQFNKEMITRFTRGMSRLGISVIFANSPEGKGRIERSFQTHQDRLIKKMRLEGIKTYTEANKYLENIYINDHNNKFSIEANKPENIHEKLSEIEFDLFDEYFAKESTRKLRRDGTIEYNTVKYQLPINTTLKSHYITVKETINGKVILYSGDKNLLYKIINR